MIWFRTHRALLALGFVSFLVFAATASRGPLSMDVTTAELSSWHIAATGSPYVDGVDLSERLADSPIRSIWVQETDHGHTVVTRSPGVVAAAVPAYALARLFPGSDQPGSLPGAITAALLTALALVLMHLSLCTRLSRRQSLAATCVLGFTTPVWTVAANGMWPHTVTFLGIAGLAWAASTERWWAAGVFGGIAIWGRLHTGIVVALLGLLVGIRRRQLGITLRVGVVSAVGLAGLVWWTHWMYGSWNPMASYGSTDLTDDSTMLSVTNQLGMWVSPGRGLLVWTPLLLLLAPALVRGWRTLPDWSRALATGTLVYTLVQGSMQTFTGGDGFYGYRYGLELVIGCTPALAFSYQRAGGVARALTIPVVAAQFVVILTGAVVDNVFMPQDRAWVENEFWDAVARVGAGGLVMAVALTVGVAFGLRKLVARPAASPGISADPLRVQVAGR